MLHTARIVCSVTCAAVAAAGVGHSQGLAPLTPMPLEPIAAILDAFKSHDLVAFPDAHGNLQSHALRLALIRDPRFAATVNDIVLELGNARFQDVADRYVRGDSVTEQTLRQIWQETTVPTAGSNFTMSRDVLDAVRGINARLPPARHLRVLLGDPPIDWSTVRTREDHNRWLAMRDSYPAALVQLEVLAKGRKALLSYGTMHYQRKQIMSNYDMSSWQMQTLVSLIEGATPARVFTIFEEDVAGLGVDVSSWPVPSLAHIAGTPLGRIDFARYAPVPQRFTVKGRTDLAFTPVAREQFLVVPAEEQLDAVLYLGPPDAQTRRAAHEVPRELCGDPGFVDTMVKRIELAGIPRFEADRLKEYCRAN